MQRTASPLPNTIPPLPNTIPPLFAFSQPPILRNEAPNAQGPTSPSEKTPECQVPLPKTETNTQTTPYKKYPAPPESLSSLPRSRNTWVSSLTSTPSPSLGRPASPLFLSLPPPHPPTSPPPSPAIPSPWARGLRQGGRESSPQNCRPWYALSFAKQSHLKPRAVPLNLGIRFDRPSVTGRGTEQKNRACRCHG
jgi:hypothetical protein